MIRFSVIAGVLAMLFFTGCTFSRAVVNSHHASHDTSWITPGTTTRAEVVARLGMPPTVINGRGGIKGDAMRWVTGDEFTGRFEAGYIVTPTFELSRANHRHDLLIKFDSHDVVSLISRTETVDGKNRVVEFREAP